MPETPSQRPNTLPLAADPAPGPRHIPRGLLRTRPAATHDTFGEAHQIRPPHPTIPLTTSISTYPYNYPPLLPPPIRNASTAPYDHVLLSRVTATLRGAPADEFDLPHEVTRAFIALCHYNLLHLAIADDAQQIQERLEHMPGNELVLVARTVQLGISDFLARGGTPQHESHGSLASSGSSARPSAGDTPRSQTQTQRALLRDNSTCLLTGHKTTLNEVSHIFPYSLERKNPVNTRSLSTYKSNFHTFLTLFAGESITSSLESYLLSVSRSRNGTNWTNINRLENLLTLTPLLHRMWDQCMFTLTPIGDPLALGGDLAAYDIVFDWLPRHRHAADPDHSQVLDSGAQLTEAEDEEISTAWLMDQRTGARLVSGSIFHLHTPDPKVYPLPHPDLLRLHAAISRVVRCAGASGEKQGDDYCGDEEGENECPLSVPEEAEPEWIFRGRRSRAKMSFALKRYLEDGSCDRAEDLSPTAAINNRPGTTPRAKTTRTAPYIHTKPNASMQRRMPQRRYAGSEPSRGP